MSLPTNVGPWFSHAEVANRLKLPEPVLVRWVVEGVLRPEHGPGETWFWPEVEIEKVNQLAKLRKGSLEHFEGET